MSLLGRITHHEGDPDKPIFGASAGPSEGSPFQQARAESLETTRRERELGGDSLAAAGVMRPGAANVANDMAATMLETGSHPVVPKEAFDSTDQFIKAKQATGEHPVVPTEVITQSQVPPDHQLHA